MRTALISDYQIMPGALPMILKRLSKNGITFRPLVILPLDTNVNVSDYIPSLKLNGCETAEDFDVLVYLYGKEKKHWKYFTSFFNKKCKLFPIRIDEAGLIERC